MVKKLTKETIFDLADTIYFGFMDTLDDKTRAKFIIKDIDNKDGTINTEKGSELYYLIEEQIKKALSLLYLPSLKNKKELTTILRSLKWDCGFLDIPNTPKNNKAIHLINKGLKILK